MTSTIQPDTLAKNDLEQIAHTLTPWLDAATVRKLISAAEGADSSKKKPVTETHTFASPTIRNAAPPSFALEETFALYRLGAKSIAGAIGSEIDIKDLAIDTSRWHHQIKVDSQPVAFARTCASEKAGSFETCQLFVSDVSGAIDDAIAWIDKYEAAHPEYAETEPLARLLVVPAFNVLALWLWKRKIGQSDLLVIDALPELDGLKGNQLLSSAEFLKAFEGHSPIAGVAFDDDDDPVEENEDVVAYHDSSYDPGNTASEGDQIMSDQENSASPDANAAAASDKKIFDIPDVQGEAALFLGYIYSATRSKGAIEEGARPAGEGGPGEPLYSAYVFPYAPPEEPAGGADKAEGPNKEQPLFVAYVFPYFEPTEVDLGGGKAGGQAALGGKHGHTLFYGKIMSFIAGKSDDGADDGGNA
ncbi:MAG TPA: hypothetical protein VGC91_11385 [Pyrinomonadaceae bacterium]|jgi:hypothetical protein